MSEQWWQQGCQALDMPARSKAQARQLELTKPAGSLGQLEQLAIDLAAMQGSQRPQVEQLWISIFAGDHGVVAEGVSAFPQAVTGQMLRNFVGGGAAISVLARQLGATLEVIDLGTALPLEPLRGVRHLHIGAGTANFAQGPAMTCLLLECPAQELVGPGTGLDRAGVAHKAEVIEAALELHRPAISEPIDILQRLGGFEIAALSGAYLACAQQGVTALVDGYICSVAALLAVQLNPDCRDWLLFAHSGAEPGHQQVLKALQAEPLLDLGLRLGEGSGAALAVPLLQLACSLHNDMATFTEAAVAERPA